MLNLVQDIGLMLVLGKLRMWLDAYNLLVRFVGKWLFGWINFAWISISHEELNVLVLSAIFSAALYRGMYRYHSDNSFGLTATRIRIECLKIVLWSGFPPAFLAALILPDSLGFYGSAGVLTVLVSLFATRSLNLVKSDVVDLIQGELVGVLGLFAFFVALNYVAFSGSG